MTGLEAVHESPPAMMIASWRNWFIPPVVVPAFLAALVVAQIVDVVLSR
jgi:hypothetical protein